jgi:outer membrane immunogenic protein
MRSLSVAVAVAVCTAALGQSAAAQSPSWTWTGFYVGVNAGYSWGQSDTSFLLSDATTGLVRNATGSNFNLNGFVGGGQIGYNWQTVNRWVFGLETDFQGSGQDGDTTSVCGGGTLTALNSVCLPGHIGDTAPFDVPAFPVLTGFSQSLDWFGTVRVRVGYTVTPTLLAYLTGGLAYGRVSSRLAVSGVNITGDNGTNTFVLTPVAAFFSDASTQAGWTLGFGLEGVLGGNWTGKIEYIYLDLGTVSGAFLTPLISVSGSSLVESFSSHVTDHIVRVGINYKWDAPPQ